MPHSLCWCKLYAVIDLLNGTNTITIKYMRGNI